MVNTSSQLVKGQRIRSPGVLSRKWDIGYHPFLRLPHPVLKLRQHLWRGDRRIVRARGERVGGTEENHDGTTTLSNSEQPWLPAQDLHKIKPGSIPARKGDGLTCPSHN